MQTISGLTNVDRFFTDYQLANGRQRRAAKSASVRSGGYFPVDLRSLYDITGHGFDGNGQTIGFTLWTAPERQAAMTAFATDDRRPADHRRLRPARRRATRRRRRARARRGRSRPTTCCTILENGNTDTNSELRLERGDGARHRGGPRRRHPRRRSSTTPPSAPRNPPAGSGLANAGCNGTDVGMEMAMEDAANDPTLHSVSNSWAYGGEAEWGITDPFVIATGNILALGAAAGTTFYFSTGDAGTYQSGYPTDSPYVVAVGGTSTYSTSTPATWSTTTDVERRRQLVLEHHRAGRRGRPAPASPPTRRARAASSLTSRRSPTRTRASATRQHEPDRRHLERPGRRHEPRGPGDERPRRP